MIEVVLLTTYIICAIIFIDSLYRIASYLSPVEEKVSVKTILEPPRWSESFSGKVSNIYVTASSTVREALEGICKEFERKLGVNISWIVKRQSILSLAINMFKTYLTLKSVGIGRNVGRIVLDIARLYISSRKVLLNYYRADSNLKARETLSSGLTDFFKILSRLSREVESGGFKH